jgi:uncharacterized protein YjbI with pentapeptide repeats
MRQPDLGGALRLPQCAFCLLVALAAPMAAHADSPPQPIPADGTCAVPVDPSWTKQEQFVWLNACAGKAADFNKEPGYGGDLDPKSPKVLPESRILRSSFLETILLKDKYRSALTRLGVRIVGARFTETVDLQNAELEHDLWLERSLLEKGANLEAAKTSRRISFDGSRILGMFNAAGSRIGEDLSMYQTEFFNDVNLLRAHIGNVLDLRSSTVRGNLSMNGISADGGLIMRDKAQFEEIDLTAAHIEQLDLSSSTVTGVLNMNQIHVDHTVFMQHEANFKEINLVVAHIGGQLDLSSSRVTGMLNMNGIIIDQVLIMRDKAQFGDVNLRGAHTEQLDLNGSTVAGMLDMYGIRVDQVVFMSDKAQFKEINLSRAHIEQLNLTGSTVTGTLNMNQIQVDQAVFMGDKANFNEIDLAVAHVGGQLDLNGSTVTGKLAADYIDVEQTASLGYGATFTDQVDLRSAKLGQDLDLSGGTFDKNVDLSGARIGGVLGLRSTQWLGSATLNLAGAAAGGIDLSHSWPDRIFLNEFTYRNLSNISANISQQAEKWFGKQAYAPQPYEQLASVLQANGLIDEATDIRYAGKVREWRASSGLSWVWLFLLNYSIGFGYHLEYAFAWALGFVLLGWAVLYATGQRAKHGMTLGLAYSFDMLLPLVQLDKKHDDVDLDPWPQRYFYAHKIVGVLLASFIAAGISGLTK